MVTKMINVGTPEQPVMVPEDVAQGKNTPVTEHWFLQLVNGAIVIPGQVLDRLLNMGNKNATKS